MRSAAELSPNARLALLGLLVALASALQLFETLLPNPAPWLRLGLGNALVLVALSRWGVREAAFVAAGKVLVGGLIGGRFLGPGFLLAVGGTGAATAVMATAVRLFPYLGFIGVSVLGAVTHGFTQLALARFLLLRTPALWSLAPVIGVASVVGGCVTGFLAYRVCRALEEEGALPSDAAPGSSGHRGARASRELRPRR